MIYECFYCQVPLNEIDENDLVESHQHHCPKCKSIFFTCKNNLLSLIISTYIQDKKYEYGYTHNFAFIYAEHLSLFNRYLLFYDRSDMLTISPTNINRKIKTVLTFL